MHRDRLPAKAFAAAVLAVALAACGSTVQVRGQSVGDGDGLAGSSTTPGATGGQPSSVPAGSTAGGVGQLPTTTTGNGSTNNPGANVPGAAGPTAPPVTGVNVAVGPGVTSSTISFGAEYTSDAQSGATAVGAGAASAGDERQYYNAVVNYINAHGGVAGRKLVPVFHAIQSQSSTPMTQQDQSACDDYNKDHKVFLVMGGRDVLNACGEKAHAVVLGVGNEIASTFTKYPHYIDPVGIRLDRLGAVTVNGLATQKYFGGKLGLVTWDDPNYVYAMKHGFLPALAKLGIVPDQVVYAPVPQSFGEIGSSSAAISNYVLQFQSRGIDHVIIEDGAAGVWGGTGLTISWMNAAQSQHYTPRYGLNSWNSIGTQLVPPSQWKDSLGVVFFDTTPTSEVGWHPNKNREACYAIMQQAGITVSGSNALAATTVCDAFFFLKLVLSRATAVTNDAFIAAANQLGTAFPPASVFGTRISAQQHDGGDLVRNVMYDFNCTCVKFTSTPYRP